ncbi:hypothetical protein HQ489_03145 [Candidatus Woesearchaeota archaeon]|nr:hypothetical protein [Candidatus Woesearchaeota archaeon]
MRGKLIVLIVLLLLTATFVSAATDVELIPIKNEINLKEIGSYSLKITNSGSVTKTYKIFSLESGWLIDPLPEDRTFSLKPSQSRSTTITIRPSVDFKPGIYAPSLIIDEYEGTQYESYNRNLKIYLSPDGPVDYLPSIKVDLDMPDKIYPSEAVPITLELENRNPLDLTNLKIRVQSEMNDFEKEMVIDLPPLERKTAKFTIIPDPHQQPKEYTIFIIFERQGEQVKVIPRKVEILPEYPSYAYIQTEEVLAWKYFYTVRATNPGNVKKAQDVKIPTNFWRSLFAQGVDDVKVVDGQRYLTWERSLSPGEEHFIHYAINYRLGLYLLLAIIFFTVFYYAVRSPITVIKTAVAKHSVDQETLSEIKVTLEVRNTTKRPVRGVEISDLVPAIANVQKSLELGTLRPKEIRNTKKGTKVIWALAEIDGQEHRIITYKIKAKLNILGTFSLPRANLEFMKGKGKKKGKAYSNVFKLSVK